MIKIVHLISGLGIGGSELMLLRLLSAMNQKRFQSVVMSLTGGQVISQIENLGIPVYCMNYRRGRVPFIGFRRLISLVDSLRPDILQGWMYHGNLASLSTAFFLKQRTPVIWNVRGTHVELHKEGVLTALSIYLTSRLSGFPSVIINNSLNSALMHERKLGYSSDTRRIIANGFDVDLFKPSSEAYSNFCEEHQIKPGVALIGLIGRYHPVKDHSNFLHAAALLVKKGLNVRFVLVGDGLRESNDDLMSLILRLELKAWVILLGQRNDIAQVTSALTIACSSSYSEGFPNSVGEAMSCAVPCVVTDVGDSAWLVGDTGKVVPPRDSIAFAGALEEMVKMDPGARGSLGMRARERIVENFSLKSIVAQYEDMYESIYKQFKGQN